ncbi:MAG: glycosyltransferase family 4 protein [Planctomycetota bacterium]
MRTAAVSWPGHPHAPAPVRAIFRHRLRGADVIVHDDAGREVRCGVLRLVREAVRILWLQVLDGVWTLSARCLRCRRPRVPPEGARAPSGPVAVVLPILPDLSHTFVYREVLALLRRRPDWILVALERNERAPLHEEARRLLPKATFLPRDGVTRGFLRRMSWLFARRGRELVGLYADRAGGSPAVLAGKNPLRDPRHPGNAFLLADLLRERRPSAIHVYGSTYSANVAMGAAHLLGIPFSITSYVDFEFDYLHRMLDEKVARCSFFRVCTDCCRRRLEAMVPGAAARIRVIHFGLDLAEWSEPRVPAGKGILFSAARLVPKKGLALVPRAMASLRARGVDVRWRLAGDGPEFPRIRDVAASLNVADAVDFLGPLGNEDVRKELRRCDIAVLPCIETEDGERDGIPIFLTEAMALGVPVVTTAAGGIPELVVDGETGFLAAAGDPESLADVLAFALTHPDETARVAEAGRSAVRKSEDVEKSADLLLESIERRPCGSSS